MKKRQKKRFQTVGYLRLSQGECKLHERSGKEPALVCEGYKKEFPLLGPVQHVT